MRAEDLARQDRNGTRTSEQLRQRYRFGEIDLTAEEVEELKKYITVDSALSTTSIHPVQNKVITQALNNKVNRETGKTLSSNDFTDALKAKLEDLEKVEVDDSLSTSSINPVQNEVITNALADKVDKVEGKGLSTNDFTDEDKEKLDTLSEEGHTHTNKAVLDQITNDDLLRWRNVAFYEAGGATDVNTTTEELVLSDTNTPDTGLWYVKTMFYSAQSSSSNRAQVAYAYNRDKPIMTRYYINDTWSNWKSGSFISLNIGDYEGYVWYADGTLEQWGRVSITPTAANTVTNATITFPKAYDYAPDISAIPQVAYPNLVTTSIGGGTTTEAARQSMIIYMTRTNTASTLFRWRTKGYKTPS